MVGLGLVNTSEITAVFARRDLLKRRIAHVNTSTESLAQLGLEWIPSKNLRLALAGKRRGTGPDGNRVSANGSRGLGRFAPFLREWLSKPKRRWPLRFEIGRASCRERRRDSDGG